MLSEKEKLKPTYLIGYVNRKKSREKSFMITGVSYKNFRYISLKYNKTFLYNNSPFIWGYHIGASYLRYVSVSWNPSGGDDELRKFYAPVLGGHFGLQWKIFQNRYISVSTEILSFQLPFNLLKITIK